MTSIFKRRNKYDQTKTETPTNINNSNMYRPKNLSFQKGGNKYNPNGYDVINEQMFNDIQKLNGNAPVPLEQYQNYQENMSRQLANEDYLMMQQKTLQNKKIGKKLFPAPVYDYLSTQHVPQVQQYIDPNYMLKNQYQQGGLKGFKPQPSYNFNYLIKNPNYTDSTLYKSDFESTPNTTKREQDIWGNVYTDAVIGGRNELAGSAGSRLNAYEDYQNQLLNYIKSNPKVKKQVEKISGFRFQEGGMPETPQMEQQEQPGQEQGQEQQIMQMVAQALQQGQDPQQIMQMLVQQGIPQEQAQMIIQEVMAQMQQPQQQMPQQQMGGYRPKGLSFDY